MESVSAAVVNWNGREYIGRCLDALLAQSRPLAEVLVVDNASSDGSVAWIRSTYPQVSLLENECNEGFAAGSNRAIAACRGDWVLVLNPDVFLAVDFIEQALGGQALAADVGAVSGQIFQQATDSWISGGFFMRRQIRILPSRQLAREELVFGASGAAVLLRRITLDDICLEGEYFDASYFMYGEDIDLSWRMQLLGWKTLVRPQARAHHIGSASLGGRMSFMEKPLFLQRQVLKNRYLTLVKNADWLTWAYLFPWLLLTELLLWPLLLLRRPTGFPYLLLSVVDAVRLLPVAWRRRRLIHQRRVVTSSYIRTFFRAL